MRAGVILMALIALCLLMLSTPLQAQAASSPATEGIAFSHQEDEQASPSQSGTVSAVPSDPAKWQNLIPDWNAQNPGSGSVSARLAEDQDKWNTVFSQGGTEQSSQSPPVSARLAEDQDKWNTVFSQGGTEQSSTSAIPADPSKLGDLMPEWLQEEEQEQSSASAIPADPSKLGDLMPEWLQEEEQERSSASAIPADPSKLGDLMPEWLQEVVRQVVVPREVAAPTLLMNSWNLLRNIPQMAVSFARISIEVKEQVE